MKIKLKQSFNFINFSYKKIIIKKIWIKYKNI